MSVGETYNSLTVIGIEPNGANRASWTCRCECGKIRTLPRHKVVSGHTKSCGCKKYRLIDLSGRRFERLTVQHKVSNKPPRWFCQCSCGNQKIASSALLLSGHARSCGCLAKEVREENGRNARSDGESAGITKMLNSYRGNSRRMGRSFELTFDEFASEVKQPCYYCGNVQTRTYTCGNYTYEYAANGLDRIDNSIGYILANVRACCYWCNRAKHTETEAEFLAKIEQVYLKLQERKIA